MKFSLSFSPSSIRGMPCLSMSSISSTPTSCKKQIHSCENNFFINTLSNIFCRFWQYSYMCCLSNKISIEQNNTYLHFKVNIAVFCYIPKLMIKKLFNFVTCMLNSSHLSGPPEQFPTRDRVVLVRAVCGHLTSALLISDWTASLAPPCGDDDDTRMLVFKKY